MWVRKWWFLLLAPSVAFVLFWAGILKTEEIEGCQHCLAHRFRDRAFWLGMNYATTEYPWSSSSRTEVCAALNRPCVHDVRSSFVRKRMWGGVYCACPCINGITSLSSGAWSTPEFQAAIRRVAEKDPEFADEFVRHCLLTKDEDFLEETVARIKAELESPPP